MKDKAEHTRAMASLSLPASAPLPPREVSKLLQTLLAGRDTGVVLCRGQKT